MRISISNDREIVVNSVLYEWDKEVESIGTFFDFTPRFTDSRKGNSIYTDDANGLIFYQSQTKVLVQVVVHFYESLASFFPRKGFIGEISINGNRVEDKNTIESLGCFSTIDRNEEEGESTVIYYYGNIAITVVYDREDFKINEMVVWHNNW